LRICPGLAPDSKKSKKEDQKKEKEEEKKKADSKQEKKKKRREEREHLHHLHRRLHYPYHHLPLVRMEMGMTSTTAQEFPRKHSSPSQSPRPSPRMIIEVYPLTMIIWRLNLRMISLYPLASCPNLMGPTLLNGSI
jgi:hypothetical protein